MEDRSQYNEETKTGLIVYENGTKHWLLNGLRHRINEPAVEDIYGNKYWYRNGKRHRENGPAIEYADGERRWYLEGQRVTCGLHNKLVKMKAFW